MNAARPQHPRDSRSHEEGRERCVYRMTVAYDGRAFMGWQRHGELQTVQGSLERALTDALGVDVVVQGAGRTDRGAHARAQVASWRAPRALAVDVEALLPTLNARVPAALRVRELARAPDGFHARVAATGKRYRYVIYNDKECPKDQVGRVWHVPGALDVAAMADVCPLLVGALDFASFATKANHKRRSTVRHVTRFELTAGRPRIEFEIEADGFLYKMVRNIIRAVVKVGEGRLRPADILRILRARDRKAAPGTAPASGLYLDAVFYADEDVNHGEDVVVARAVADGEAFA